MRHVKAPNRFSHINLRNTHKEIKGKHCLVFISFIIKQEVGILCSLSLLFLFWGRVSFFCINPLMGADNERRQRKARMACLFDTCIMYVLLPLWSLNITKTEEHHSLSTNFIISHCAIHGH